MNENFWISSKISLKYVPWGLIDNMASLVQIMVNYKSNIISIGKEQLGSGNIYYNTMVRIC